MVQRLPASLYLGIYQFWKKIGSSCRSCSGTRRTMLTCIDNRFSVDRYVVGRFNVDRFIIYRIIDVIRVSFWNNLFWFLVGLVWRCIMFVFVFILCNTWHTITSNGPIRLQVGPSDGIKIWWMIFPYFISKKSSINFTLLLKCMSHCLRKYKLTNKSAWS